MRLEAGTRLGPYELVAPLGAGGMGEVWRARDGRLGRDVAVKALPEVFASDPERLSRFEREAKILASLSHANIAAIYGLEEVGGRRYLILECVEGPTLGERLERGALPLGETLATCRQIASALEAAHESGVVHRDLKPSNVKLTQDGEVKVLDFGLAKGAQAAPSESGPDLSQSPTRTYGLTGAGVILGTAAYMSPEQARGKGLDRRTDIWSFGCILYECLTGRQLFAGETISDMIAKILEREPDWSALPAQTPERVRALLRRCLEKDARRRLRDIGEARIELEEVETARASSSREAPAAARTARPSSRWAWGLVALLAVTTAVLATARIWAPNRAQNPIRFSVASPLGTFLVAPSSHVAISPNGRMLAFVAVDSGGTDGLWIRPLDSYAARRLEGTEGAEFPFWSPDARHLAFFAKGKLRRVALAGGEHQVICDANNGRGGAWSKGGLIVFAPAGEGPLYLVRAAGGEPSVATALDTTRSETGHRYPCFLPDGRRFLYTAVPSRRGNFTTWVAAAGEKPRVVVEAAGGAVYAEPGHLIYRRGAGFVAQRFDTRSLRVKGDPVALGDSPAQSPFSGSPLVSVSSGGAMAYVSGASSNMRLVWMDRGGNRLGTLPLPPGFYDPHRFSPDGSHLAVSRIEPSGESDVWIVDVARATMSRFTFGPGITSGAIWSPDGRRIAFESNREGPWNLYVKPVAGGEEELIYQSRATFKHPNAWTADGRSLIFEVLEAGSGWDLWVLDLEERKARPLLTSRFNERSSTLSPDGRWLAYTSDESGSQEIYVRSFPAGDHKQQVSTSGGLFGSFRADGRELIYLGADGGLWSASLDPGPALRAGLPRRLAWFPTNSVGGAVFPTHEKFLAAIPDEERAPAAVNVVLDWPALVRQRQAP